LAILRSWIDRRTDAEPPAGGGASLKTICDDLRIKLHGTDCRSEALKGNAMAV
jgi:hypothetical protein